MHTAVPQVFLPSFFLEYKIKKMSSFHKIGLHFAPQYNTVSLNRMISENGKCN